MLRFGRFAVLVASLLAFAAPRALFGGGPRLVAGSSYFDPAVMGQPIRWPSGQIGYYLDQGPLSATVSHSQAAAMVDAAAGLWSAVPTAAVGLTDQGSLNEDVSGLNAIASGGSLVQPADVAPTATGYPIGIVFDTDGSVIDALFGSGTSDPSSCDTAGVVVITDNILASASLAHALMILNGRCTDTVNRRSMMSFLVGRAFGLVLGLGHSQVYTTRSPPCTPPRHGRGRSCSRSQAPAGRPGATASRTWARSNRTTSPNSIASTR